ncbi:MAG: NAD-dependent epimerase/dehydratase family protein, partial [Gemmatimonadetes bacterium]|nr:NAD-dependent epimerase/dehydratase family protein [Gemmatimonadota bacterium]
MTKILITGSTGLIGRHLTAALRDRGDEVVGLTRSESVAGQTTRQWDPSASSLDPAIVSGFD